MSAGGAADNKCAVCDKQSKSWCAGCKTVYYCSVDCQLRHWKSEHNKLCKRSGPGQSKPQHIVGGKRRTSIRLVPSSGSDKIKLVDKVLFPYDEFVKLFNWDKLTFRPCGLLNCGNSCFANVVLQCLCHTRPLVAYLMERGHRRDCRRGEWCFLCELEVHMHRAISSEQPFSPLNILSKLPSMGGNLRHGNQEDAHEFMRFAIDMMQSVCLDEHGGEKVVHPKSQQTTLIQHIYGGQLQSQVKCTRCSQVSNQYENMMDLTVEIQGGASSLEECLDQFTANELLDGENMYRCDRCKDYVIASKRLSIYQAPNILTIALKRFEGGIFGKINKKITFPELLDLSPYMSEERDGTDKYELYAVVVHVDMLNASFFGHYICYTKSFGGDWYWIDDCKVERVELDEVLSQGAYMLLYKRVSARPKCLKTFEPILNQNQIGNKMTTVAKDLSATQMASSSPALKSTVAEDSCPTQMASSSNAVEPSSSADPGYDMNKQSDNVHFRLDPRCGIDHGPINGGSEGTQADVSVSVQPASNSLTAANGHSASGISMCSTSPVDVDIADLSATSESAFDDTLFVASDAAALISDNKTRRILECRSEDELHTADDFFNESDANFPLQRNNKKNKTDKLCPSTDENASLAFAEDMEVTSVELNESSNCSSGEVNGMIR